MSTSILSSRPGVLICLAIVVPAILVVLVMPGQNGLATMALVFSEGLLATLVLASATAAGLNGLHLLLPRTAGPLDRLTHFLLAVALGLGFLSLATLALGLAGLLSCWVFFALLLLPLPTGFLILQRLSLRPKAAGPADCSAQSQTCSSDAPGAMVRHSISPVSWLWLLASVPLGLAVLGAALPPGILWPSEARGYDVLEYHLAGPKEYLAAGRIRFLSHNVYTNMPSNVEMLYLLAMTLKSEPFSMTSSEDHSDWTRIPPPYNSVHLVHFINLWIAVLAVLALYRTAGYLHANRLASGLVLACCPWLLVVATMAYVEAALLLYTILAVFVVLAAKRLGLSPARSALLAGIFAGLACGCKLTAVVLTALPVLILLLLLQFLTARINIKAILIYSAVAFLVLCPWLAKNFAFTNNPFFPLFHNQLDGRDFSPELAQRWNTAHSFDLARYPQAGRAQALWEELIIHPQFGLAVTLLPIPVLLLAWRRGNPHRWTVDLPLLVLFSCQLLAWMTFTYMPSRFFIVALVPLCLLVGRSVALIATGTVRRWLVLFVLMLACVTSTVWSIRNFFEAVRPSGSVGLQDRVGVFLGRDSLEMVHFSYVNTILPSRSHILMVGDATSFYWSRRTTYNTVFNINPLAEQVRAGSSPRQIIGWLVSEGFTHLYVDYSEISRLSATYGYPPEITPVLFVRLERYGLIEVRRFPSDAPFPRAVLYRIVSPAEHEPTQSVVSGPGASAGAAADSSISLAGSGSGPVSCRGRSSATLGKSCKLFSPNISRNFRVVP